MVRPDVLGVFLFACSSAPAVKPAPQPAGGSPFDRFEAMPPKVGDIAPAFDLIDANGGHVKLADAIARGPVVLVWGSFT
jgi:hypothetical protein